MQLKTLKATVVTSYGEGCEGNIVTVVDEISAYVFANDAARAVDLLTLWLPAGININKLTLLEDSSAKMDREGVFFYSRDEIYRDFSDKPMPADIAARMK